MKTKVAILTLVLPITLAVAVAAAEPPSPEAAFEQLTSLEGRWVGKAGAGEDAGEAEVLWEVTSGGHTVVERLFPGTDHEMMTLYWLEEGRLVAKHFCTMGNQPSFELSAESSAGTLRFDFAGGSNLESQPIHIHDGELELFGDGRLCSRWSNWDGDQPRTEMVFELERAG